MESSFETRWHDYKTEIDGWLHRLLPPEAASPSEIHRAMRYSVFAGGKRLRAVLVAATADALGSLHPQRYVPGCALEMIHTYSLIHDDLPAMDDDDFRRGKPTNHKVFGEALAILAGDALLTHAFFLLSRYPEGESHTDIRNRLVAETALAAGTPHGMLAGQVLDILSAGQETQAALLHEIHRLKTGALLRLAVRTGGFVAGADEAVMRHLTVYGEELGLAFQITDDILDRTATLEDLGKTPGKDAAQDKLTFPAVYGLEESRTLAEEAVGRALAELDALDDQVDTTFLAETARFVLTRGH